MESPAEFVRGRMNPLQPVLTECEPHLPRLSEIRSVVFDIYGTLIISAAGDISLVSEQESHRGMGEALEILGRADNESEIEEALEIYRKTIGELQESRRAQGAEFPEIEIRDVWRTIAANWQLDESRIEAAALAYECAVNPCWEMPGAAKMIGRLERNHFALGIVSNAQFYTSAVVEGVCGFRLFDEHFDPDLSVFSFLEREGKPSRKLFEKVASAAKGMGIEKEEILYIGNDFTKDVAPAHEVGFRTALFAGDERSLRTGSLETAQACSRADVVLTELPQLEEVLGLKE